MCCMSLSRMHSSFALVHDGLPSAEVTPSQGKVRDPGYGHVHYTITEADRPWTSHPSACRHCASWSPQITQLVSDNGVLRTNMAQMQGHMQSMTQRVYELTHKYETVTAENLKLKAELSLYRPANSDGRGYDSRGGHVGGDGSAAGRSVGSGQDGRVRGASLWVWVWV